MGRILVTGVGSGLGKYLHQAIKGSVGLSRDNLEEILDDNSYSTIIHCAFNKQAIITDLEKYLEDNIVLTQKLLQTNHVYFIYISSVDVYAESPTLYATFKRTAELLIPPYQLILRCPMLFGPTMKPNHAVKLKNNVESIGLSGESTFNYVLMEDLAAFFQSGDYKSLTGIYDFVSEDVVVLKDVKSYFNSNTKLGEFTYVNDMSNYTHPIYKTYPKYKRDSFSNLKKYFG